MTLDDALDQIADIRSHMANARVFRGIRCTTTLFSSFAAIVAAVIQSLCIPDAVHHVDAYLKLWFSAGGLCLAVVACGMVIRYRRSESPLDRELSVQAVYQFLPCLLVGGLFTYVLAETAWQTTMWILPGIWAILFGMGILACRQLLPKGTAFVGGFYLFCGLLAIALAKKEFAFSPLLMGVPFGIGQLMAAGILYWKLERNRVPIIQE
jgi:hypothetical protein